MVGRGKWAEAFLRALVGGGNAPQILFGRLGFRFAEEEVPGGEAGVDFCGHAG